MSDFVNKVLNKGKTYDIHDSRIENVPESVSIEGTSLVIPEQPAPEPVIEIDGIKYYHKQEFDLEELAIGGFSLLTKEAMLDFDVSYLNSSFGSSVDKKTISIQLKYNSPASVGIFTEDPSVPIHYESKAFTVVDTLDDIDSLDKICLPTCSAYYGFLSEDGKTFISYYNLKSDGAPEYIDSVKQGNAVISLKDLSAGGTKLYLHNITVANSDVSIQANIALITDFNDNITVLEEVYGSLSLVVPSSSKLIMSADSTITIYSTSYLVFRIQKPNETHCSLNGAPLSDLSSSGNILALASISQITLDTVTEL